jgi:hypothetical protein
VGSYGRLRTSSAQKTHRTLQLARSRARRFLKYAPLLVRFGLWRDTALPPSEALLSRCAPARSRGQWRDPVLLLPVPGFWPCRRGKNVRRFWFDLHGAMPIPESATLSTALSLRSSRERLTLPDTGVYLTALSSRILNNCCRTVLSPATSSFPLVTASVNSNVLRLATVLIAVRFAKLVKLFR